MLRKQKYLGIVFLASLFFQTLAQAQFYTGPIAASMGGAGRAGNSPSESAFLNPASLAELKNYYGSVSMNWGDHPIDGSTSEFAGLLADGTPDKSFPGQFSYVQKRVALPNGFATTQQDFQLAMAFAPSDSFGYGLAIHRVMYQDNSSHFYNQNNINIGTLFAPMKKLAFAFVAYDVFGGDDSVPQAYQTIPTLALGGSFKYEASFMFSCDFVRPDKFNDGNRINTQVGLETYFRHDFAVRAGWQWREVGLEEKLFSLGLGYRGPRLSFDYSYQKDVLAGTGFRQYVDLWLHF